MRYVPIPDWLRPASEFPSSRVNCCLFGRGKLLVAILLTFVVLGPFGRTVLAHGNEVWQEYCYLGGMEAIALGCLTAPIVSKSRFSRHVLVVLGGRGTAILI